MVTRNKIIIPFYQLQTIRRKKKNKAALGLFYYQRTLNFGDVLNADLAQWLGITAIESVPAIECDAVFIGSLLHFFLTTEFCLSRWLYPPVKIWGAGFISAPTVEREKLNRRVDIHAVRGYHSLERLKKITGKKLDKVAVGDPGLLASYLIDTSAITKKHDLGIVPHFVDKNHPSLSKINVKNSMMIDIQQKPLDVLRQISQCNYILSSAMHGLIAADALGIPNVRMIVSDKIIGGDYKYDDYYSALGIVNHHRIDLNSHGFTDNDLPCIAKNYTITRKQVTDIQDALLNAFPYKRGH